MSAPLLNDVYPPSLHHSTLEHHTNHLDLSDPHPTQGVTFSPSEQAVEVQDLQQSPQAAGTLYDAEDSSDERDRLVEGGEVGELSGKEGDPHMNRKNRSRRADHENGYLQENGDVTHQNGDMATQTEYRRKVNTAGDGSLATPNVAARNSYSLDQEPEVLKEKENAEAIGFFDLPIQDRKNFLLLVLLYFLQGIPMGLAGGSVPFLLKSPKYGVSYGQIGVFSLASYPYSLKLLWSPIVDAVWSRRIGRRKSWILPVQVFSGLGMLWLGANAESMMASAGANDGAGIWGFTGWWFFLVFTCATQDIAVDGWAITILSQKHLAYASTAQTVGLTGGSFLSFTVFLAFSDPHFANKWFRSTPPPGVAPSTDGLWSLGGYLIFWGWMYLAVTIGLALFKREDKTRDRESVLDVYKVMLGILKLKNVQTIIIIHLIAKIGFQANDGVTNLKLLDKGFGQDNMSLTVLIDFPFELGLGYYAGKWSSKYPPMHLWCWAFIGRLVAAAFAQFVVMIFPAQGVTTWYLLTVIVEHVFSTFMNTVMFVAVSAFHAKIADPVIGGTYMTLLATVSNLGGTFPRFFVLKLVETFTSATCFPQQKDPAKQDLLTSPKSRTPHPSQVQAANFDPFACVLDADKSRCSAQGGVCVTRYDGYYIMNVVCIVVGVVTFVGYIRPRTLALSKLPLRAWRLNDGSGR